MLKGILNPIAAALLILSGIEVAVVFYFTQSFLIAGGLLAIDLIISASPRLLQEWERGVLLRLGKFQRVLSPGIVWVIPGIDNIVEMVDMRIRSTPFTAEKTLTKDTVPVNVDAVLFWVVTDAQRAVLEVEAYLPTISWAAGETMNNGVQRAIK